MKERFNKRELLAATRQLLTEVAAWAELLFGPGSTERLTGLPPGRDPEFEDLGVAAYIERDAAVMERKWDEPGSAGVLIEQSAILKLTAKVVDFLNTNIWQGDAEDFWLSFIALYPFQALLEDNWHTRKGDYRVALNYAVDSALDQEQAEKLLKALKTFSVRANFERENDEISISELAWISGLAEKTIRMAAVGQDKNPDLVTFKNARGSTCVEKDEARRWMLSKNINCHPPQYISSTALPPVEPTSLVELGHQLERIRKANDLDPEKLADQLQWKNPMLQAYRKLEDGLEDEDLSRFTTSELIQLASLLLPDHCQELALMMDKVIHPLQLKRQIDEQLAGGSQS